MEAIQKRGVLTQKIKNLAYGLLGHEICRNELRLYPYILYVLQNEQKIDPMRVNDADGEVLAKLATKGFIMAGITHGKGRQKMSEKIVVSKSFYNAMNEIVWQSYICLSDE